MKKGIRVILLVVMLFSIVMMVWQLGPLQACLQLEYDMLSEHPNWKLLDYNGIYVSAKVVAEKENEELILAIPYNKNWKAEVDGKPVSTNPTEDNFTGILLKRGAHILDMKYQPMELALSVTCLVMSSLLLIYVSVKGKKMTIDESVQTVTEELQKEVTAENVLEQRKEELKEGLEKREDLWEYEA